VAEVGSADYSVLYEMVFHKHRKTPSRRAGDPRFFVCRWHIRDPRLAGLDWQDLFDFAAGGMTEPVIIVSASGTRHIVGKPPGLRGIPAYAFRITTLCGFGVREEDVPPLSHARGDCEFCLRELAVIEQHQQWREADHAA
jgi:hypothetical protein